MDFLSAGTKKVAIVERWPLVDVQLYCTKFVAQGQQNGRRGRREEEIAFQTTLSHHPKKGCISGQTHFSVLWGLWTSISFPSIPIHPILRDPGVDSRGEGKSKWEEKYGTKKRRRPLGTGLVRRCPQGLFLPFFAFLRAIFFLLFWLSLAPTLPWVSEDAFIPPFCNSFKFSWQTYAEMLAIYAGYLKCCIVLVMTENNSPEKTTFGIIHPSKTKFSLWFVWMC